MSDCFIALNVEEENWNKEISELPTVIENVKNAAVNYLIEQEKSALLSAEKTVIINLCLSNDAHIHNLNKQFRNMDKPTNVLSFANIDFADFAAETNLYQEIELGDIIIAYETMLREAKELQISLHDHFCHLLTHGILHLCGYDHIEPQDAKYMEHMEVEILQQLHIANPYE